MQQPKQGLSLTDAMKSDRLQDFISQEEKRGIGPANKKDVEKAIEHLAKSPRPADRTSRSASRGGSRGK